MDREMERRRKISETLKRQHSNGERNHIYPNIGKFFKGKKLSLEHREKLRKSHMGHRPPNWKPKGTKLSDGRGYIKICQPDHPNNNNRYVLEHRLIMEKHLGRYLLPTEIVHHINGIKDDNRIENLSLFNSNYEHTLYHKNLNRKGRPGVGNPKTKKGVEIIK